MYTICLIGHKCLTHNEAKQTETSEFGAEKGLWQGHARRQVALAHKTPELLQQFQQSTFKGMVRGAWLVVANFSVLESFVLAAVQAGQVKMFL